jgi:hypothetical protein
MLKNCSLRFFTFCVLQNVPASGQSHWRSSGHCQTVGNAFIGFALRAIVAMLRC